MTSQTREAVEQAKQFAALMIAAPRTHFAYSDGPETVKTLLAALSEAEEREHRVCDGCGTSWSSAAIKAGNHLSCCPEREMKTAAEYRSERDTALARIAEADRKIEGYQRHLRECEQIAGKALSYPWFKDDQANFPGSTEADGVCVGDHVGDTIVAELADAHSKALARIAGMEAGERASPNGDNPYYTPRIMAGFRAYKEATYGGKLADEAFRLGNGKYEDEPHYTQMAIEFRLFKAGAEWVDAFRAADTSATPAAALARAERAGAEYAEMVKAVNRMRDDGSIPPVLSPAPTMPLFQEGNRQADLSSAAYPAPKKTMTLNLTEAEMAALEEMMAKKDLTAHGVFRQSLKVFQLIDSGLATLAHASPAPTVKGEG